jgi:hypothetical protein
LNPSPTNVQSRDVLEIEDYEITHPIHIDKIHIEDISVGFILGWLNMVFPTKKEAPFIEPGVSSLFPQSLKIT